MELLIVTGLSGAGKSQVLRKLEDMGMFCVDNLPCDMLRGFVTLCEKAEPEVERAAVVVDSREMVFRKDIDKALEQVAQLGIQYKILYLDCRTGTLLKRYNETRRPHPMTSDVETGIELERELLGGLRDRADYIIDTSDVTPLELMNTIEQLFIENTTKKDSFAIVVESFGYKRGVPFEADMVFDVRFTPNPFYDAKLRTLSGKDEAVREFILKDGAFTGFLDIVEGMLRQLIPLYIKQDKHRLLVAFGCTGGRHRSVCAAEELSKRLSGEFPLTTVHRDMKDEAALISEKSGVRS